MLGEKGRKYKKVNWMKAAFLSADKLLTVSPTYATEIAANESQGVELDGVIRCACMEYLPHADPFGPFDLSCVREMVMLTSVTLLSSAGAEHKALCHCTEGM